MAYILLNPDNSIGAYGVDQFDPNAVYTEEECFTGVDGKFYYKDFAITPEYMKIKRLEEIVQELKQADSKYEAVMDKPVLHSNGYHYKPKYVQDSYVLLLAADIFPITIWDSTELHPVDMIKIDLLQLSMFLKEIAEPAFQKRKQKRLELLLEKEGLIGVINE